VYSSALAKEMGMYFDPADLFGRLKSELFMSMRLVVDNGMNALGWSRAEAMEYMRELGVASDVEIESETLRYSADAPAQALAYKMGHLRIVELRKKAKSSSGDRFSMKRFHEAVLGSGQLPLAVLGRQIELFIMEELRR
jgi:uncharacterized protein (DUF885 family)